MKFGKWFDEHGFSVGAVLGILALVGMIIMPGIMSGCKKKPAQRTHDALRGMHYVKDPKSKQCFAINGNRMAWVPCSAVQKYLEPMEDCDDD